MKILFSRVVEQITALRVHSHGSDSSLRKSKQQNIFIYIKKDSFLYAFKNSEALKEKKGFYM